MIVAGVFNADLDRTVGQDRDEDIMAVVATAGKEDVLGPLLPQRSTWCKDRRTWAMVQQGMEVRSRMDYILEFDRLVFRKVSIRYPGHNSNHFMVMECLRGAYPRDNSR